MTFKVQKTENNGVVYAEPADPDQTVRVKHSSQVKNLGVTQVTNQVTEVILNDTHAVDVGGATGLQDAISIRVRISGALQSSARKKALLTALCATLANWDDEDVFNGFNPTTVPVSAV